MRGAVICNLRLVRGGGVSIITTAEMSGQLTGPHHACNKLLFHTAEEFEHRER